eukprot:m.247560 g.247560  ORF g.247560 m.247560 type:complete len:176 (-) comp15424_c0_seq1:25-552(-)
MAELHIIGALQGGTRFPAASLFCKWQMVFGPAWRCVEGALHGQTQVDEPQDGETAKWGHPIDIHLASKGLQGWPKISVEVWHYDMFGRCELYGYGFCHVPTTPGMHELECVCWRPAGSVMDEAKAFFIGGGPQLVSSSIVHSGADRSRLRTVSAGVVKLRLGVIARNFARFGVET